MQLKVNFAISLSRLNRSLLGALPRDSPCAKYFSSQDPTQISQRAGGVLCTLVVITIIPRCNQSLRCPACVNFNPQLEVVQKATKDIPLKVVKVGDIRQRTRSPLCWRWTLTKTQNWPSFSPSTHSQNSWYGARGSNTNPFLLREIQTNAFIRWGDKVPTYMFTQHRTYDKRMGLTARWVQWTGWLTSLKGNQGKKISKVQVLAQIQNVC